MRPRAKVSTFSDLDSDAVLTLISDILGSSTVESWTTVQVEAAVDDLIALLAEGGDNLQPAAIFDLARFLAGHGLYSRALRTRDLGIAAALRRQDDPPDATRIAVLIERNQLAEAEAAIAVRRAAGIDTSRFEMMMCLLNRATPVSRPRDARFAEFSSELQGKSICLVGPAATSSDIAQLDANGVPLALIKRVDLPKSSSGILYLNSLHSTIVARECRRPSTRTRYERFEWIVGKFARGNDVPTRVREMAFKPVVPFRSPSIAPRAIADLLNAGVSSVRLSGFSLYLGHNPVDLDNYLRAKQGLFAGRAQMKSSWWANRAHSAHDLFGQFLLLQNLCRRQLIVPDSTLGSVLAMSIESYADALDLRYSQYNGTSRVRRGRWAV